MRQYPTRATEVAELRLQPLFQHGASLTRPRPDEHTGKTLSVTIGGPTQHPGFAAPYRGAKLLVEDSGTKLAELAPTISSCSFTRARARDQRWNLSREVGRPFSPVLPAVLPTEGTPRGGYRGPRDAGSRAPARLRSPCSPSLGHVGRASGVCRVPGTLPFPPSPFFRPSGREGEQGEHAARTRVGRASRRSPYRGER